MAVPPGGIEVSSQRIAHKETIVKQDRLSARRRHAGTGGARLNQNMPPE
jgi:hypothetical protein